jgi:hypothetical protein
MKSIRKTDRKWRKTIWKIAIFGLEKFEIVCWELLIFGIFNWWGINFE